MFANIPSPKLDQIVEDMVTGADAVPFGWLVARTTGTSLSRAR